MSRQIEELFLTKMLESGNHEEAVINEGITREHFHDAEMREVFSAIVNHYERFGEYPSLTVLQSMIATFEPVDSDDSLPAVADRMREVYTYNELSILLRRVQMEMAQDPLGALTMARDGVMELSSKLTKVEDLDVSQAAESVLERYLAKKEARGESGTGLVGLPWLWDYVNDVTGGIQGSDFIVMYAQAKSYKTWVLIATLIHIFRTTGKRIVMATREMTQEQVTDRVIAQYAGLSWAQFNNGRLPPEQEDRLREAIREFQTQPPFIIVEIQNNGMSGVSEFKAKCQQYGAEVAAFDGVYFLSPKSDWKELTECTRGIRRVSLELNIPVIAVTQANKDDQAGYSRSFQQDVTYLINIKCEQENRMHQEALVSFPFVRDHALDQVLIHAKPGEDFSQKRTFAEDSESGDLKGDDEEDNIVEAEVVTAEAS